MICPECSFPQIEDTLMCPQCGALIFRDRLKDLYEQSRQAEIAREWEKCLRLLSECLSLLPPQSRQYIEIREHIRKISHLYSHEPPVPNPETLEAPDVKGMRSNSVFGVTAAVTRSLFRGLVKPKTFISLIIWVIAFSLLMGWKEALVFGLLIYVHEMGHLFAIQYYGYRFSWPMFVPFLGAFVLQGKQSESRRENFVISLSGPFAGMAVSLLLLGFKIVLPLPPLLNKMAYLNLIINFFNLLPVWLLDGARISRQLSRMHFLVLTIALFTSALVNLNVFLFIMGAGWLVSLFILWNTTARARTDDQREMIGVARWSIVLLILLILSGIMLKSMRSAM